MLRHKRLPHVQAFASQPLVFLTVVTRARRPVLACAPAFAALTQIWTRSAEHDGWFVGAFILMPDHVHLFARATINAKPLARWIATWKSLSSRALKNLCAENQGLWQRDYFDRFVRSAENFGEKWDYVANNPVRAGLCARSADWPWRGELCSLEF
jgi:putative transposase